MRGSHLNVQAVGCVVVDINLSDRLSYVSSLAMLSMLLEGPCRRLSTSTMDEDGLLIGVSGRMQMLEKSSPVEFWLERRCVIVS